MKFVKQSFEIIPQEEGIDEVFKHIELAARTCYKSQEKITENSAKDFVEMLIKNGHLAMLEHGTVYLHYYTDAKPSSLLLEIINFYKNNQYSKVKTIEHTRPMRGYEQDGCSELIGCDYYITTNLRVCLENNRLEHLTNHLCSPTEYHQKRITVKLITDQGILREFTRHRKFSFAVESTRYCCYSKDKFDNQITYIIPPWVDESKILEYQTEFGYFIPDKFDSATYRFIQALKRAEYEYMYLIEKEWKPQQARNVLPLATKCEMIMTGFIEDWEHFFKLRADSHAHPQAQELAYAIKNEFIRREYIK